MTSNKSFTSECISPGERRKTGNLGGFGPEKKSSQFNLDQSSELNSSSSDCSSESFFTNDDDVDEINLDVTESVEETKRAREFINSTDLPKD